MIFNGKELISMAANSYVRVKDVAKELDISEGMAYKIIRKLNNELKEQGSGRLE